MIRSGLNNQLLQVEECINRGMATLCLEKKEISLTMIEEAIKQRNNDIKPMQFLEKRFIKQGFMKKSGVIDYPKFYRYARINPDVWSTFSNGSHAPSKETLLKIIIALKMIESEAKEFLSLCGSGFAAEDYRDTVILACIDCEYYEIEDVYEILEFYGGEMIRKKRRFHNIY